MRNGLLAAATILMAHTVTAWSQELGPPAPTSAQPSNSLPSAVTVVPSAPTTENWIPPFAASNSSYFGNPPYAGDGYRFWGSAELLLWSLKPGHTPPLVTSGTIASGGALGPGTTTLFGGNQSSDPQLGGRFTLGTWLNPGQTTGIEGSFFFMNGPSDNFNASSSGDPAGTQVLARPFVNAINGQQDSQTISYPGVTSGNTQVTSSTLFLGAQLNGLCNLLCCMPDCCATNCCNRTGYRLDMIGGFQYLALNENLNINENLTILPTAPAPLVPGSTIDVADSFQTRNNFYGGQVGARAEWWRGAWFMNVSSQVALGDTHQEVIINGSTAFTNPGGPTVHQPGGLLALPTNMGTYSRDQFSVVPQVGLNVGRQLTNNVRIFAGYTFIYWSNVVRPGDQIDPVVNPTQLPSATGPGTLVGPARPAFSFHESDLWVQGVNFGLEVRI
jgi:hypothetical protein